MWDNVGEIGSSWLKDHVGYMLSLYVFICERKFVANRCAFVIMSSSLKYSKCFACSISNSRNFVFERILWKFRGKYRVLKKICKGVAIKNAFYWKLFKKS